MPQLIQRPVHNPEDSHMLSAWREAVTKKLSPPVVSYTPTIAAGGAMTIATPVITTAKYINYGHSVELYLDFTATTGVAGDRLITFTLPVNAAGLAYSALACVIRDGAGVVNEGSCYVVNSTGYLNMPLGTVFGLGTGRGGIISGRYLIS